MTKRPQVVNGMENHKILVVDDEEKILLVIKLYLEKDGFLVTTSTSGKDALLLYQQINPDLIILDLMLPDLSGETVCREIRKTSAVPIIMLTAKIDEANVLNGFEIGADDYVLKPFSPRQLIARVKAVLRRGVDDKGSTEVFNHGDLSIDYQSYDVYIKQQKIDLTPIEFKILALFSKNSRRVFTREEIIYHIYHDEFDGYDRAIDSHIKNLRKKLSDVPPKYILTVHGIGYKFGGDKHET